MHSFSLPLLVAPAARASSDVAGTVLADLPSDPASVFILLLLFGSVGLVVWFGRKGPHS